VWRLLCSGSWVGGGFVLIYYIYFPFFPLGGGGGSSFLSFPFLSLCFLHVRKRGSLFFQTFREKQKQKQKVELEIYQVRGGVELMCEIRRCWWLCVNAVRCTVLYSTYCTVSMDGHCFALVTLACWFVYLWLGGFFFPFVLYILLNSTPVWYNGRTGGCIGDGWVDMGFVKKPLSTGLLGFNFLLPLLLVVVVVKPEFYCT